MTTEIISETLPRPCLNIQSKGIQGKLVAVEISSGEYHVFNGVGGIIWKGLTDGLGTEAIVKNVMDSYDVPQQQAEADFQTFIQDLQRRGLLQNP